MAYDGSVAEQHSLIVPESLACPMCENDDMDSLMFVGSSDGNPLYRNHVKCRLCKTTYDPIDELLKEDDAALEVLCAAADDDDDGDPVSVGIWTTE